MDWYHREILIPFAKTLRMKETRNMWKEDNPIDISKIFTYKVDSAIPYLNRLLSPELEELNEKHGISVIKIAAAATESWQENDAGKCMKSTANHLRFLHVVP